MILYYTFNVDVERMVDRYYSCEDIEPDYETVNEDVDFEYYVDPDTSDFARYIYDKEFKYSDRYKKNHNENHDLELIEDLIDCEYIDVSNLEDDDDFKEFMTDYYEDDARSECESEYES